MMEYFLSRHVLEIVGAILLAITVPWLCLPMEQAQDDLARSELSHLAAEFSKAASASHELSVRLHTDRLLSLDSAMLRVEKGSLWLILDGLLIPQDIPEDFRLVLGGPGGEEVQRALLVEGGSLILTRATEGTRLVTVVYVENLAATSETALTNLSTSRSSL